jgi:hypothetical protein
VIAIVINETVLSGWSGEQKLSTGASSLSRGYLRCVCFIRLHKKEMSERRAEHLADFYSKRWHQEFSTDRNFKDDRSYLKLKRDINAEGDESDIFMQDNDTSGPSCEAEEVEEFIRGLKLADLKSAAGAAGHRRAVWLDDRTFPGLTSKHLVREYQNPITATGLYQKLEAQV